MVGLHLKNTHGLPMWFTKLIGLREAEEGKAGKDKMLISCFVTSMFLP